MIFFSEGNKENHYVFVSTTTESGIIEKGLISRLAFLALFTSIRN